MRRTLRSRRVAHLVLYDGVCGLCNRGNRFILKRDRLDAFRFAALQSEVGRAWVARLGGDAEALTTMYVVADFDGPAPRLLARADAVLFIARELGGLPKLALAARILPRRARDACYRFVAATRYAVFGKHDACLLPPPGSAWKFMDPA